MTQETPCIVVHGSSIEHAVEKVAPPGEVLLPGGGPGTVPELRLEGEHHLAQQGCSILSNRAWGYGF